MHLAFAMSMCHPPQERLPIGSGADSTVIVNRSAASPPTATRCRPPKPTSTSQRSRSPPRVGQHDIGSGIVEIAP